MNRYAFRSLLVLPALATAACDADVTPGVAADATSLVDTDAGPSRVDVLPDNALPPSLGVGRRFETYPDPPMTELAARGDGRVLVATTNGLYHASAPDYALTLDASLARLDGARGVVSVVALDGGGVVVLRDDHAVFWRADDTSPWTDITPDALIDARLSGSQRGGLVSDGQRVVYVNPELPPQLLEDPLAAWVPLSALAPAGDELAQVSVTELAFLDDDKLICSSMDYRAMGAYTIAIEDAKVPGSIWKTADGLEEWGYTSFVFGGGVGLTANDNKIFRRRDGEPWAAVLDAEVGATMANPPGLAIVALGDAFIAAGADGIRRSVDGASWEHVSDMQLGRSLIASDDDLVAFQARLMSSNDRGTAWQEHASGLARPRRIGVQSGTVRAVYDAGIFEQNANAAPRSVAPSGWMGIDPTLILGETFWAVNSSDRQVYRLATDDKAFVKVAADWGSEALAKAFKTLHAVGDTIFAGFSPRYHEGAEHCDLHRLDADGARWVAANAGLPNVSGCNGAITSLSGNAQVAFAVTPNGETYRSDDRGASWVRAHDKALVDVVTCGARTLARDAAGGLFESADDGRSFVSLEAPGIGPVAAIAAVAGSCVVGVDRDEGDPTLLSVGADATFHALGAPFTEPVVALAGDGKVLAVATSSVGLVRFDVETP